MRVDLFYDLLRFSPRSIDLFISMNISPPTVYTNKAKMANTSIVAAMPRLPAFALE